MEDMELVVLSRDCEYNTQKRFFIFSFLLTICTLICGNLSLGVCVCVLPFDGLAFSPGRCPALCPVFLDSLSPDKELLKMDE